MLRIDFANLFLLLYVTATDSFVQSFVQFSMCYSLSLRQLYYLTTLVSLCQLLLLRSFRRPHCPYALAPPLPRNALRRFAPSEHILIYQLYSPSSTTFFTCFLSLSFVRFLSLFIPLLYLLIRFIRPFFTPSLLFVILPLPLLNK